MLQQPEDPTGFAVMRTLLMLATLLLAGCTQQLHGDLTEGAANLVVGALRSEGIRAEKKPAGESTWRVSVPEDEFARSVQILKRRNLPPQQFDGLGSVFRKDSLVSTLTEERARLIYAMSRELERTLYEIDGVIVARVHPVIPPSDPLNPKKVASSAAVLVKYRPGAEIAGKEAMVRSLVAAGIEGLSYDDVRVHLVAAEVQPIAPDAPSVSRALPPMFWGILGVLTGLLLLSYFALTWRNGATVRLDELRGRLLRRGKPAAGSPAGQSASQ
ncbi:MAG: type III secretion system inner membrane ring lipoprotein SctJ [Pseudomonadota bacterium]|jgi:type III secretion protein J|nr:type III secretion inner membrane ring lipoprotein SctJ [Rubrivivax sp.]MCA3260018.1 type III secretion inner membrane ring lipoprotein SctJ [Rubrivivax sp.]MCZ8032376.1 type III secretion inner membrane ring lipoprotein SctJ [Rubrivivax sp.]